METTELIRPELLSPYVFWGDSDENGAVNPVHTIEGKVAPNNFEALAIPRVFCSQLNGSEYVITVQLGFALPGKRFKLETVSQLIEIINRHLFRVSFLECPAEKLEEVEDIIFTIDTVDSAINCCNQIIDFLLSNSVELVPLKEVINALD